MLFVDYFCFMGSALTLQWYNFLKYIIRNRARNQLSQLPPPKLFNTRFLDPSVWIPFGPSIDCKFIDLMVSNVGSFITSQYMIPISNLSILYTFLAIWSFLASFTPLGF